MTDSQGLENWELTLDSELALIGRAPAAATAGAPSLDSAQPGEEVDMASMRDAIFKGIRQGGNLPVDICDEAGKVVLPAGSRVTKEVLRELREQGLERVSLRIPKGQAAAPPEIGGGIDPSEQLHTARSRVLDERMVGELLRTIEFRPVKAWRRPKLPVQDLKDQAVEGVERHAAISKSVAELCESMKPGKRISSDALQQSITQFVNLAAVDFDLLPLIVALQQSGDEYLYDHCVNVAMLSMAMSSQLGLRRDETAMIGLAGLLQDVGMLRVSESIRLGTEPLTEATRLEIRRHPLHTLDMLADLKGIPPTVQFIAYQMHERSDGSGYPRGRKGSQLHQYTRLVSLADAYSAMIRSRPHREAMTPYQAMKSILQSGAEDKFDRELVRALLDTISLFPIGSKVGLSDGNTARVLRATPEMHTRPVVEPLSIDGTPTGEIIDLSKDDTYRIINAS